MPGSVSPLEENAQLLLPMETDTPEVRIGTGGALAFAAQVIGLAASFLVGILVARALGPEGKGILYAIMQVSGILLVALDFGITTSLIHYLSRGEVAAGTAAGTAAILASALGALGSPVVLLLLRGPLAVVEGVPDLAVLLAVLILPTSMFATWLWSISMGLGDMVRPLWYAIAAAATTLIALAALIGSGHATIVGVLAASVAGTCAGIVAIVLGLRRRLRPFAVDLRAARDRSGFSLRVYATDVAGHLHIRQDVLLLGWIAGAASVGLYSVGTSFAELTWYIPSALAAVIIAKAGRTTPESGIDYVSRTSRVAVVFMFVTVAVSAALVPWLVPLLYGAAFAPAVLPFFVLLPGVVVDGVTRILWNFQTTQGRVYWRQAIASTLFNIVLILLLVPRIGIAGAALASTASYAAIGVFVVWRFCRDTGARASDVLIPRLADLATIGTTVRDIVLRRA